MMGKAGKEEFLTFKSWFEEANKKLGKKQYLVPYFMSSHPGCALEDAIELCRVPPRSTYVSRTSARLYSYAGKLIDMYVLYGH